MYTNEALYGIDELTWCTTICPSFNLEVVLESVMALCPHKVALKAVTYKRPRSCTAISTLAKVRVSKTFTYESHTQASSVFLFVWNQHFLLLSFANKLLGLTWIRFCCKYQFEWFCWITTYIPPFLNNFQTSRKWFIPYIMQAILFLSTQKEPVRMKSAGRLGSNKNKSGNGQHSVSAEEHRPHAISCSLLFPL